MKTKSKRKSNDSVLESIFARRLETAMLDMGVGAEEFDYDNICSAPTIKRYLNGDCLPTLRTVWRIADYLGVSVDYLCGMDDTDEDDILDEEITNELTDAYNKKRDEFYDKFDSEAPWGTLE